MLVECYQPGSFIFGHGALDRAPDLLRCRGLRRPLIVADAGVRESGLFHDLLKDLPAQAELIPAFSGEPTFEVCDTITELVRQSAYDSVIAIGGGASLDIGKVAALMATNVGRVSDYFSDERKASPLPKLLIPTTAGSGSETSSSAVIRCPDGIKRFVSGSEMVADIAIVDSRLTVSCPRDVVASSGMDVISTGLEAYLSKQATPFSDAFAIQAVELGLRWIEKAYLNREDIQALDGMALGASFSGIAFSTPAGVNICHCIAETLGPIYDIPHGKAVAVALPYMVAFNLDASRARLGQLARRLGLTGEDAFVPHLKALLTALGLETGYRHLGVPYAALEPVARMIYEHRQFEYDLSEINPAPITLTGLKNLLEDVWLGQ